MKWAMSWRVARSFSTRDDQPSMSDTKSCWREAGWSVMHLLMARINPRNQTRCCDEKLHSKDYEMYRAVQPKMIRTNSKGPIQIMYVINQERKALQCSSK